MREAMMNRAVVVSLKEVCVRFAELVYLHFLSQAQVSVGFLKTAHSGIDSPF